MKLELLVMVDQNATVNTFSGLVHTARQVNKVGSTLNPVVRDQGDASDRD